MPRGMVDGLGVRYENLTGTRIGRLVVAKDVGRDKYKNTLWLCRCDCGTDKVVSSIYLRTSNTVSCGCLDREMKSARRTVDLTGQRFGRIMVLSRAANNPHGKAVWNVSCDCGAQKTIIGASLTGGRTVSCGCHNREVRMSANITHGMSNSPEYKAWASMIARCTYPSATGYENYGGRGIKVCDQWARSFETFYTDVGARPSGGYSLDRYPDVDGNYEPDNVRWASVTDQARNKRSTVMLSVDGQEKPLVEWCETRNLNYRTVRDRIYKLNWTAEEALGFVERMTA